jgi:hypothetical protein
METMTLSVDVVPDQDRKGPGRPRSARVDEAIVEAVFELLSSGQSADAISMRNKRMAHYGKVTACLMPELFKSEEMTRVYQRVVEPRRDLMRSVLRRGIASGELHADLDVELALLVLSGPTLAQNMLRWNPNVPDEGFAENLVDFVLRGARAE